MYSPAAATMLALRPAAAAAAGRRAIATSALAQQSSSSLNSLKNSFWDALSGKSPKPKPQKDGSSSSPSSASSSSSSSSSSSPSDQAGARGRGFARRRPSLFSSPTGSSPTAKSADGSAPTSNASGAAKDSPKHRSSAARRGPVGHSATARSRYPEPFIFETFQPPALADINFVDGNPWSRTVQGMRPLPKGELLTEEKAKIIREFVGGEYSAHVAVLPKEVEAKLDGGQKRVLQGAMRVLNANASYKVEDKMTVVATVVEGATGGQVKRSEVLKK